LKRTTKAFLKLFLSYTAVLLLPLICMSGIQSFMSKNMQARNCAAYQSRLTYAAESVSTIGENIQTISSNILVDRDVQSFINTPVIEKKSMSDLYIWKDVFDKYHLDGFNVQSIHLYSAANNWIIEKGPSIGTAVKMDGTMYDVTLGYTGMTYTQWQEFVTAEMYNGFYLMPSGELIYRMNIFTSGHRRSLLLIRVNTSPIAETIESITMSGGYIAVCDANGSIILSSGTSPFENSSVFGEIISGAADMQYETPVGFESFRTKTSQNWHIFSFQSMNTLHADVQRLSSQLLMITLFMLAIDIILCLILSRNNAAPLKRLVSFVSSQIPRDYLDSDDGYLLVENTMAMLIEKNTSYRKLNDEQRDLINFELVRCLLMGEYQNLDRMDRLIRHSCLPMENCKYGVIAIPNRSEHTMRDDMDRIRQTLADCEAKALAFHDRCVILFFLPVETDEAQWFELSHELAVRLNTNQNTAPFRLCISDLRNSCDEIHIAFDETVAILEIMRADSEHAACEMHFSNLASSLSENWYDYPIDMELQIIHALKAGNTALVTELLNEVRVRNYSDRKLSASMSRQLMFEVRGTVIRGIQPWLSDAQVDRHVRELCRANTLESLFQHIEDLSVLMADLLHTESDRLNSDLEDRIYVWLSENYTNANLTLQDMTGPIGRSERFLYDFIRERFNSSFSKLLEGLRITKACALLRDGEVNVKNVASQVGYNSDHTFRLAFKRVMNVTPSEYAYAHTRQKNASPQMHEDEASL